VEVVKWGSRADETCEISPAVSYALGSNHTNIHTFFRVAEISPAVSYALGSNHTNIHTFFRVAPIVSQRNSW
jgi:hypothetical protein